MTGELRISREDITYISPLKTHRIRWDEVKEMEVDTQGYGLILYGEGRFKRLVIPGSGLWRGKERAEMARIFEEELKMRRIPATYRTGIGMMSSNNTRVS